MSEMSLNIKEYENESPEKENVKENSEENGG